MHPLVTFKFSPEPLGQIELKYSIKFPLQLFIVGNCCLDEQYDVNCEVNLLLAGQIAFDIHLTLVLSLFSILDSFFHCNSYFAGRMIMNITCARYSYKETYVLQQSC